MFSRQNAWEPVTRRKVTVGEVTHFLNLYSFLAEQRGVTVPEKLIRKIEQAKERPNDEDRLSKLSFKKGDVGDEEIKVLALALWEFPIVGVLDLRNNNITHHGLSALLELMRYQITQGRGAAWGLDEGQVVAPPLIGANGGRPIQLLSVKVEGNPVADHSAMMVELDRHVHAAAWVSARLCVYYAFADNDGKRGVLSGPQVQSAVYDALAPLPKAWTAVEAALARHAQDKERVGLREFQAGLVAHMVDRKLLEPSDAGDVEALLAAAGEPSAKASFADFTQKPKPPPTPTGSIAFSPATSPTASPSRSAKRSSFFTLPSSPSARLTLSPTSRRSGLFASFISRRKLDGLGGEGRRTSLNVEVPGSPTSGAGPSSPSAASSLFKPVEGSLVRATGVGAGAGPEGATQGEQPAALSPKPKVRLSAIAKRLAEQAKADGSGNSSVSPSVSPGPSRAGSPVGSPRGEHWHSAAAARRASASSTHSGANRANGERARSPSGIQRPAPVVTADLRPQGQGPAREEGGPTATAAVPLAIADAPVRPPSPVREAKRASPGNKQSSERAAAGQGREAGEGAEAKGKHMSAVSLGDLMSDAGMTLGDLSADDESLGVHGVEDAGPRAKHGKGAAFVDVDDGGYVERLVGGEEGGQVEEEDSFVYEGGREAVAGAFRPQGTSVFTTTCRVQVVDSAQGAGDWVVSEEEVALRRCGARRVNLSTTLYEHGVGEALLRLDLSGNQLAVVDAGALAFDQMPRLMHLNLSCNLIKDMRCVNGDYPRSLRVLDLSSNAIRVLEGLEGCGGLEALRLGGNRLTFVDGIYQLTRLFELDVSHNRISKATGLRALTFSPSLRVLGIAGNKVATTVNGKLAISTFAPNVEVLDGAVIPHRFKASSRPQRRQEEPSRPKGPPISREEQLRLDVARSEVFRHMLQQRAKEKERLLRALMKAAPTVPASRQRTRVLHLSKPRHRVQGVRRDFKHAFGRYFDRSFQFLGGGGRGRRASQCPPPPVVDRERLLWLRGGAERQAAAQEEGEGSYGTPPAPPSAETELFEDAAFSNGSAAGRAGEREGHAAAEEALGVVVGARLDAWLTEVEQSTATARAAIQQALQLAEEGGVSKRAGLQRLRRTCECAGVLAEPAVAPHVQALMEQGRLAAEHPAVLQGMAALRKEAAAKADLRQLLDVLAREGEGSPAAAEACSRMRAKHCPAPSEPHWTRGVGGAAPTASLERQPSRGSVEWAPSNSSQAQTRTSGSSHYRPMVELSSLSATASSVSEDLGHMLGSFMATKGPGKAAKRNGSKLSAASGGKASSEKSSSASSGGLGISEGSKTPSFLSDLGSQLGSPASPPRPLTLRQNKGGYAEGDLGSELRSREVDFSNTAHDIHILPLADLDSAFGRPQHRRAEEEGEEEEEEEEEGLSVGGRSRRSSWGAPEAGPTHARSLTGGSAASGSVGGKGQEDGSVRSAGTRQKQRSQSRTPPPPTSRRESPVPSVRVPSVGGRGSEGEEQRRQGEEGEPEWAEGWNEDYQHFFYFNQRTGESVWEKPDAPFVPYDPDAEEVEYGEEGLEVVEEGEEEGLESPSRAGRPPATSNASERRSLGSGAGRGSRGGGDAPFSPLSMTSSALLDLDVTEQDGASATSKRSSKRFGRTGSSFKNLFTLSTSSSKRQLGAGDSGGEGLERRPSDASVSSHRSTSTNPFAGLFSRTKSTKGVQRSPSAAGEGVEDRSVGSVESRRSGRFSLSFRRKGSDTR